MRDITEMTIAELVKLGFVVQVSPPSITRKTGYFVYDGAPIPQTTTGVHLHEGEDK